MLGRCLIPLLATVIVVLLGPVERAFADESGENSEPQAGYCSGVKKSDGKTWYSCAAKPKHPPFFLSGGWNSTKRSVCEAWCAENSPASAGRGDVGKKDVLTANGGMVPVREENASWASIFETKGYGPKDVYTDVRMEVTWTGLSTAGVGCEKFSRANAFVSNFFNNTNSKRLDLVLIISDEPLGVINQDTLQLKREHGVVVDIMSFQRSVEGDSCTAKISTSGSKQIARVRADRLKPLNVNLVYLMDRSSDPLGRFRSDAGDASGASDLIGILLNGKLTSYGDELSLIADHVTLKSETVRTHNEELPVYPLSEDGKTKEFYDSLKYDVVVNGQTLAKFKVYQSGVSEYGDVAGELSIANALTGTRVADSVNRQVQIKTLWSTLGPARLNGLTNDEIHTDFQKLIKVCDGIEGYFREYDIPNRALERLQALLLKEFQDKASYAERAKSMSSVDGKNACLKQHERARHRDIIPLLIGDQIGEHTCMSLASMTDDGGRLTKAVIKEGTDLLQSAKGGGKAVKVSEGAYFESIKVKGVDAPSTSDVLGKLADSDICYLRSDLDDDAAGKFPNPACSFFYVGRTTEFPKDRFWVQVNASVVPEGIPSPTDFVFGADVSELVSEKAAIARSKCVKYTQGLYD